MKKLSCVLGWAVVVLIMFCPICLLLEICLRLTVTPFNYSALAVIMGLICTVKILFSLIFSDGSDGKVLDVLFVVSAPLSILNLVLYVFEGVSVIAVVSLIVSCGCVCILAVKYGKSILLKTILLTISGLLIVPACFFCFTFMIMSWIGADTVVETVPSPNGGYYAEVVDSDQGALGGNTIVIVKSKEIDLLVLRISKSPQRVYIGEWREYENMRIYWKDKNSLVINSMEYDIKWFVIEKVGLS